MLKIFQKSIPNELGLLELLKVRLGRYLQIISVLYYLDKYHEQVLSICTTTLHFVTFVFFFPQQQQNGKS